MTDQIAIVAGVPMPKPSVQSRKHKYPFATLQVGGMFFLPGREDNSFATYAGLWGRKLKRTFRTRLCYMRALPAGGWELAEEGQEGAVLGVGVWRVA